MASEWGPFHEGSHSTRLVMTFTMFHAHTHTHTLMGPVTAVTFAGAGPQTERRGPREPQAAIVLSPRKPASLCQTCFSVCFLFYVFNVGKGGGNVSPPSVAAPRYSAPHPRNPSSSSSHRSIHICFYSFLPPDSSFTTPFSPVFRVPLFLPLEIICKSSLLGRPISLSLGCGLPLTWTPPPPPFFNFDFMRIWHKVAFFVFFPKKWYSCNSKTT